MSWLNTIKGQLNQLAQEVLTEGGNILTDEDYQRSAEINPNTAIELLAETQKQKDELDKQCTEKDSEIAMLRKQIVELTNQKISDSGGGGDYSSPVAAGPSNSTASATTVQGAGGRYAKPLPDGNSSATLEDSWCWELDSAKQDNDHSSETSSSNGNGNEMVNITLEEAPLPKSSKRTRRLGGASSTATTESQQKRLQKLEEENKQLNVSLEELDSQHNLAMQNVLELKSGLQQQLGELSKSYETLKKEHAEKFINSELELGKLRKQCDQLVADHRLVEADKQAMAKEVSQYTEELRRVTNEMADLQALLEKKTSDNVELIERIKEASTQAETFEQERAEWQQKLDALTKETDELKEAGKAMKTSESSSSSNGKQSEDEFIVVREGDASSSGPTTPPSKEELKDKIVQLENRVSELTLENGSLALKLQDREMEKQLSSNVLKENLETLQTKCNEQAEELRETKEVMEEQLEKIADLKEKAGTAILAEEKVKVLQEEKVKIDMEITKMKESLQRIVELETRLVMSEREKESLQLELQGLRTTQERVTELESLNQKLTIEVQQMKLNTDDEIESSNKRAELEAKIKQLGEENDSMRTELEVIAQEKFRQVIEEEKKEITDLDADDDDESISEEKLRELLKVYAKLDEGAEFSGENLEKSYKELRDRLMKIDRLEKNLRQMSEEISDLQDSKLVWDHEKKTFEADISQYILQCDELMKNNEILLNELENYKRNKLETISENNEENMVQLESQLEECSKLNRTLEEEYAEMTEKNEELERENKELADQLRVAQDTSKSMAAKERDYTLQLETLELEKCNLLFELNEWKSSDDSKADDDTKDKALAEAEEKCHSLESQLESLSKDHADLVAALQSQKASLMEANRKREDAEKSVRQQEVLLANMRAQMEQLQSNADSKTTAGNEVLDELRQELMAKDIVAESLKAELKKLQEDLNVLVELKQEKEALVLKLQESEEALSKATQTVSSATQQEQELQLKLKDLEQAQEKSSESAEQLEQLQNDFEDLKLRYDTQSEELKQALEETAKDNATATLAPDTGSIARIAELETELLATADLQKSLDALTYEKNEMIKALQQKHSENMQYYMEIQRLQPMVQELQQQQNATCEKCPTLEALIGDLKKEQEKQQDQINFLKEKSDILTTNLLTEQTNQRLVRQEKTDVEEQNTAIRKDLERLRQHLLEVEELHTQETVEMQRELDETKTKMLCLQDECSKSSNAYTSASIRANQHAETLQAQYALLVQQRDELVAKLSLAEDRESKNQAALCNLQCALEQFQNDKENDIKTATLRIRKELQHELNKEADLQNVISSLQQQLEESNQGLRAASRLSDQLEQCQQTIAVLREEVETLKQHNSSLEDKLNTSESSQTDKIEKNLIKSLLIGYVVSGNANDKTQVLRMISSVLDFNATESDKVGLNKQNSSWLGSILGSPNSQAGGQHSKENLAQAFVQFLQQESQPKAHTMPTLLNMGSTESGSATTATAASRRTSVVSNSGSGSGTTAQQPLPIVLNSNILSEFAPSRNSSSILKDILNDS